MAEGEPVMTYLQNPRIILIRESKANHGLYDALLQRATYFVFDAHLWKLHRRLLRKVFLQRFTQAFKRRLI